MRSRPALARNTFVACVIALGALVFALVAQGTSTLDPDLRLLVGVLAALLVVSELRPMQWHPRAGEFTASWGFAGAMALIAPAEMALAALAVASIAGDVVTRKSPLRLGFNVAALVLSLGAGIGVLDVLGVRTTLVDEGQLSLWFLPATLAFAVTVFAVNLALMAVVVRLDRGLDLAQIVRNVLPQTAVDDLLLLVMAPVFAVVGLQSAALLPLPLLGVAAMHHSAKQASTSRVRASRDALTGLANRNEILEELSSTIAGGVTVVMIDLDEFKGVNDRLGHAAGDKVLEIVAKRLVAAVRPVDLVGRLGGDEFVVVLEGAVGHEARVSVERIRRQFTQPIEIDSVPVPVGASFGAASAPLDGTDPASLLESADAALMLEKMTGRVNGGMRGIPAVATVTDSLSLLRNLKDALTNDELSVVFQPQVAMPDGETVGFEALVRWERDGVTILPGEFVYVAEHTELIGELTDFVLVQSLATCARWWHEDRPVRVSVNVSARSLADVRFVDTVRARLEEHGLPGRALEVEFTESALLVDLDGARVTLEGLADLGVAVAIDDFGTGYSSFEHLRRLPISRLKIDRSFVGELERGLDSRFVAPMIVLGHNLGLTVVAEGVEQPEECEALHKLGCDIGQGWHFGRPLPPDGAVAWLERVAGVAVVE